MTAPIIPPLGKGDHVVADNPGPVAPRAIAPSRSPTGVNEKISLVIEAMIGMIMIATRVPAIM